MELATVYHCYYRCVEFLPDKAKPFHLCMPTYNITLYSAQFPFLLGLFLQSSFAKPQSGKLPRKVSGKLFWKGWYSVCLSWLGYLTLS